MSRNRPPRLVLVGGGHTHAQVLEELRQKPIEGLEVHLVVDRPIAIYSGMVPGFVAGDYRREQLEIDVADLARRAGAVVHLEAMRGLDPVGRAVVCDRSGPLSYDVASLNVGSTVAGLDLPGVRRHSVATRPMSALLEGVEGGLARARSLDRPFRIVVVGGGAAGVELAFCFDARVRDLTEVETTLVTESERILEDAPSRFVERVERELSRRRLGVVAGRRAREVTVDRVRLEGGEELPHDLLVWATGAVGPSVLRETGSPLDSRGFLLVDPTLRVEGRDDLFAVGDCATPLAHPGTPKAGVYAVRQGPVLLENLRRWLSGRELAAYRPQADFLRLLNLGDGRAVGGKWGFAASGRWVMRVKDRIDRRFVGRFRQRAERPKG